MDTLSGVIFVMSGWVVRLGDHDIWGTTPDWTPSVCLSDLPVTSTRFKEKQSSDARCSPDTVNIIFHFGICTGRRVNTWRVARAADKETLSGSRGDVRGELAARVGSPFPTRLRSDFWSEECKIKGRGRCWPKHPSYSSSPSVERSLPFAPTL